MRGAHPGDESWELEVFATGATTVRTIDDGDSLAEHAHHTGELVREAVQHARDFHARPGHRPGRVPMPGGSRRRGTRADVVRPVLVDPFTAFAAVVSGELFDRPVAGLEVELPGDPSGLGWRAVLAAGRHRHDATLHLFASPSMVVTVIELIPAGRVRTRGFVRHGVTALDALAARLTAR